MDLISFKCSVFTRNAANESRRRSDQRSSLPVAYYLGFTSVLRARSSICERHP